MHHKPTNNQQNCNLLRKQKYHLDSVIAKNIFVTIFATICWVRIALPNLLESYIEIDAMWIPN